MTLRTITGISAVALSAVTLAAALAISPGQTTQAQAPVGPPFKSVPTFSTEKIGRQGHFYVGGKWEGEPGVERMRGSMYVETWVPKEILYPYPIVFVGEGGGQSSVQMLMTPDGRPGWAYDFVNRGYTVYMMDFPGRGRSPFIPGVDGTLAPPRSGPLMEEIWVHSRTPKAGLTQPGPDGHGPTWPQFSKYSAWPSSHPNKGRMGDPVFDYFAKMEQQSLAGPGAELTVPALTELLDFIGQPTIMILHSGVASYGWAVADRRPKLVKAIIAAEPVAPPMETTERRSPGTYTPGRLWGLSGVPMTYDSAGEGSIGVEDGQAGEGGRARFDPVRRAAGTGTQAGEPGEHPRPQRRRRGELSPPLRALHRKVAEPGRRQDDLRRPRVGRADGQWPPVHGREEQRRDREILHDLARKERALRWA